VSTPIVVSIGTTHPWNIAGVGLDAQVACEYGVRNATVIAGITAQDETGLHASFAVPVGIVREQLARLPRAHIGALRIGALFEEETIREVAQYLKPQRALAAVVDPVSDGETTVTADTSCPLSDIGPALESVCFAGTDATDAIRIASAGKVIHTYALSGKNAAGDARVHVRRTDGYGVKRAFAWDAFLWHIKPPTPESLEDALDKAIEKARMAARFVSKMPTARIKLATGAYRLNLFRARVLVPPLAQSLFAGLASSTRIPPALAQLARGALLDSVYTEELGRQLRRRE